MKAENFDKVNVLMAERERLSSIMYGVDKSDTITFSSNGIGRQDFTLADSNKIFNLFKESVVKLCKENIEEVDDKLAEL